VVRYEQAPDGLDRVKAAFAGHAGGWVRGPRGAGTCLSMLVA
jgi:hypothetical protein